MASSTSASTSPSTPVLSSAKPQPTVRIPCSSCANQLEFLPPSPSHPELATASWTTIRECGSIGVRCWNCAAVITVDLNGQPLSASEAKDKARAKTKIGSDQNPVDTEYYEELGVSPNATSAEIKKAYYQLAMKYHPDKNGGDLTAADHFKRISEAYQVLSDPKLRKQYNEFGKQNGPEGGFADPSTFFKAQFGGDRFADIIGDISIAHDFQYFMDADNDNLTKDERDKREKAMLEEKQRMREERVTKLVDKLVHKLSILTETPMDDRSTKAFEQICKLEAEELKNESYGVELLRATGYTYTLKAKQFLSSNSIGSMWHSMTEKTHVVSETVSTFKSAMNLQRTFTQLNEAKQKGNLTEEQRAKLEEAATVVGFETLWKGSKLEVQSVLREVCDRVLNDKSLAKDQARRRAVALKILGQTYESVKGENNSGPFVTLSSSSS